MTTLEKIRKESLIYKAAKTWGCKESKIKNVTEHREGATIKFTNGNSQIIPYEVWVLGWTEAEYTTFKQTGQTPKKD